MGAGSVKGDWRMVVGEAGRAEGRIPHVKGRHKQTTTKPTHTRKAASGSWCEGLRRGGSRSSRVELVQGRQGSQNRERVECGELRKGEGESEREKGKGRRERTRENQRKGGRGRLMGYRAINGRRSYPGTLDTFILRTTFPDRLASGPGNRASWLTRVILERRLDLRHP